MMSRFGAIALSLSLLAPAGTALAQTALTESQIIQSMQSAGQAPNAKPITAALIKQAVQQHMIDNPGLPITWKPLQLVAALPQINVQIQFALNSPIIRPESYATIGAMADALHHPLLLGSKFVITGNTDTTGNRQDNLALSQARADAVLQALVTTYNVDPARLEAVGLGEESLQDTSKPTDPINRRVQLINVGPYLPGK